MLGYQVIAQSLVYKFVNMSTKQSSSLETDNRSVGQQFPHLYGTRRLIALHLPYSHLNNSRVKGRGGGVKWEEKWVTSESGTEWKVIHHQQQS
jgi:hypothetical protein